MFSSHPNLVNRNQPHKNLFSHYYSNTYSSLKLLPLRLNYHSTRIWLYIFLFPSSSRDILCFTFFPVHWQYSNNSSLYLKSAYFFNKWETNCVILERIRQNYTYPRLISIHILFLFLRSSKRLILGNDRFTGIPEDRVSHMRLMKAAWARPRMHQQVPKIVLNDDDESVPEDNVSWSSHCSLLSVRTLCSIRMSSHESINKKFVFTVVASFNL